MGFRKFASRHLVSFMLCAGLVEVPWLYSRDGVRRKATGPERFYIVSQRISDAAPHWFDYILDVRPEGENALVRMIRIAPENESCDRVEVKAVETRLLGTSVVQVAGNIDLCSIEESDADGAIADAKVKRGWSIFESEQLGIVAQCRHSERLFRLPYPESLDMSALKRNAPHVAALYALEWEIHKRAFGNKDVFHDITPAKDVELQRFGASLVAQLRTGIYDFGFGGEKDRKLCRTKSPCDLGLTRYRLERYEGPDHRPHKPATVLLDPEKYHLIKYVPPSYPRLAVLAQIEGKVEVDISVDRASGTVKRVHAISGHPLLQKSAEDAVKGWVFHPADVSLAEPVSAVLNFSLGCVDSLPQ